MIEVSTELSLSNELIVVISLLYCAAFIILLALCVCGCRKGSTKNDFLGVDGMVKITNPDENVNHLPSVGKYVPQNKDDFIISESEDITKRPTGGSNPHRSLPDIPVYTEGDIPCSDNGVSGDTSSDLYATVEDKASSSNRHSLPNGVHSRRGLDSSIRRADNYARVRENPYDKVKNTENPYAKVHSGDGNEEISRDSSPSTPHVSNVVAGTSTEPVAPVRSRRSSLQNSLLVGGPTSNVSQPSSTGDIPAATAVAGRVAASQDLPYMTPPISLAGDDNLGPQQHFSGDSQDSSKGYTSISVREPLEHIRNQTKALRTRKDDIDPHYATVSDDSDDNMYAAIVEPSSQIYNGSETYAQIQPVTIVEVHGRSASVDRSDESDVPAPELPHVNMKHVTVHSRQASSSSCTSSIANLGSPKPEKRQANSPLPPTPAVSPDMYSRVDKTHSRENSINVSRNLEDMYAKVQKNKKKHEEEITTSTNDLSDKKIHLENRQSWSSKDSYEEHRNITNFDEHFQSDVFESTDSDDPKKNNSQEHCYETLSKSAKKLSPKKSDVSDIGYEKIHNRELTEIGYEKIHRKYLTSESSGVSNDPNYELLSPSRISSDVDPNYEILRPSIKNFQTVPNIDGYSLVNKRKKPEPGYEELNQDPNYESLPSECDNYATVQQKSTESESDPNYESVKYLDVALNEPPYERLENNSDLSEYEQISKSSHTPDYERIKDVASKSSDSDKTISDNGKLSNGTDDEEINNHKDHVSHSLEIDAVNVEEIIQKNTDENMYFQV